MQARSLVAVLAVTLALVTGCTTNPATGDRFINYYSPSEERQLGAQLAPEFTEQFGGEVPSEELQSYVADIGYRMAKETEDYFPSLEWEFILLNSEVVNAFALPGGKVFFTRGLAEKLTSEAQMAGVLGHEIGHVTAQHGVQRMSQVINFNIILAGAAVAVGVADEDSDLRKYGQIGVPALAIGGNIVLLKYGRDQESQADALGMRYMTRVGYDPRGQLEVMQILAGLSGGARPPEFLSTHPYPETRVDRIRRALASEYAHTQGNSQFQSYPERYEREFLAKIRRLPPPPPPPTQQGSARSQRLLEQPALWCAHCAEAAGT